ncbi:hypothetical protein ANO14919_140190 [Xylariales sp. No.14919]|nr:hypothetical protein ANO14919_140190 [Xylariales sp. No.14919]
MPFGRQRPSRSARLPSRHGSITPAVASPDALSVGGYACCPTRPSPFGNSAEDVRPSNNCRQTDGVISRRAPHGNALATRIHNGVAAEEPVPLDDWAAQDRSMRAAQLSDRCLS